jgi:hypothetical protein
MPNIKAAFPLIVSLVEFVWVFLHLVLIYLICN